MPAPAVSHALLRSRPPTDLLTRLAVRRLDAFGDWCDRNGVEGHVGEFSTPNRASDVAQWNRTVEAVLARCEERGLSVVQWASGNNRNGYDKAAWQPASLLADVSISTASAPPWERYLAKTAQPLSGVFVSGGHNRTPFSGENPSDASTGNFSNVNLGTYDTHYAYDSRATFDYLKSRGVRCVTISFRWERLQPTLSAAFNATESTRLQTCVNDAIAAGLRVILQPFNKGEYYIDNGSAGTRRRIGVDAELTSAMFNDLWTRLATLFSGTAGVVGYGLMNEPASNNITTWQTVSQAAAEAIEAVDTTKTIIVPMLSWFPLVSIGSGHPTAWITGITNPIRYEAHFYLDLTDGGFYTESYNQALASMATGFRLRDTWGGGNVNPIPALRLGDIGISPGWTVSNFQILDGTAAPTGSGTCQLYQDARFVDGTWRMVVAAWDTATASRQQWLVFRRAWDASFNGWRFGWDSTGVWKLQKTDGSGNYGSISGGNTVSTGTVVPTAGDVVEVQLSGARIICRVNGTVIYDAVDSYLQGATIGGAMTIAAPNFRSGPIDFRFAA